MARWRTSAAALAVALVATACGNAEPSRDAAATGALPGHAQLAPVGEKPLRAIGTGFLPIEHVQVTAKGKTANTVADAQGHFVVSLLGVSNCGSTTVKAKGDEGSHAEFNLSQIACNSS